ncbi:hypothetical protein M8J76_015365 [Diaphorina citri]|nr:hypothetical protein M8J75_002980 [Diaphorina citri]KAI5741614.1 hypothetical protein M8J76_015365 [Diaphorina citri]KAI5746632.1 hypothetical protein M8J77_005732 [Diaphorina citri]
MAQKETRDPYKRLIARDDVKHCFTFDNLGVPIRTTLGDDKVTLKYVCLAHELVYKAKLFLKYYKPKHDPLQITLRTSEFEILVSSNNDFCMVTIRNIPDGLPEDIEPDVTSDYANESTEDEDGKPKKWYKKKNVKKKKKKDKPEDAKTEEAKPEEE